MNDIKFTKTNGGMGRKAANEDPISGLLMLLPELVASDLTSESGERYFTTIEKPDGTQDHDLYVAKLRYPEELASLGNGIVEQELSDLYADNTADQYKAKAAGNAVVYHVKEFFRMNPEGTLYLGIKIVGDFIDAADIEALQNWAGGSIRQCGIFTTKLDGQIGKYQEKCADHTLHSASDLEREHKPLSLVCTTNGCTKTVANPNDTSPRDAVLSFSHGAESPYKLTELTAGNQSIAAGRCNVSMLVGCDLDPELLGKLGHYAYYGCIGTCLGAVSKAAVHECIAWVGRFPLGLGVPGLICDKPISEVSDNDQESIHKNHYIFVRTHVGNADNFFNDSHTLDVDTSDYAFIENVRTIDKACRGIRANLLPYLNSPLKVDAETGKLDAPMVAFLETTAGKALEDMEKAGELSGYRAEIDPDQNVLATSQVEVIVKNVPMGVMRKVHVKIGFTSSLN